MTQEMRKDLEQYGYVQSTEMTWVHPWVKYWEVILFDHKNRDRVAEIISDLSVRYPDFMFGKGEAHINNVIHTTINIVKR